MAHPSVKFLKRFAPLASQLSDMTGIPAEVILTQGAVESGWGRTTPGNNYFGMKTGSKYRKYPSPEDSFRDYANTMATLSRFASARAARTSEGFLQAVAKSGYSTRPWQDYYKFAASILGTVRKYSSVAGVADFVPAVSA